jgi:putative spermidine/putrescine transport system substrate-binding protein
MKRRSFLKLAGTTAVALAAPNIVRAQSKQFDGVTLRMNGYGGESTRILAEYVVRPLREKTGLNVEYQDGTAASAVAKVLASPNNPPFDLILADSPNIPELLAANVLSPVTEREIPNIKKIRPSAREFADFGVPFLTNAVILTYNADEVKVPLKSYKDLARPDLKDRVGMLSPENTGGLLTLMGMAEAYGGTLNNMAPVFDALRKMKGNVAAFTSEAIGLVQFLEQEEVVAAPIFDGRAYSIRAKGMNMPTVLPEEGIFALYNYLSPLKAGKHKEAVYAYINEVLSDEAILEWVKTYRYAPVTDVLVPADVAKDVTINNETSKLLKPVDWKKVATMRGALIEEFNKAMQ